MDTDTHPNTYYFALENREEKILDTFRQSASCLALVKYSEPP